MMVDLEERVSQLESWTDGKGLIVQGAAGTFCSGSDLNAVRAISNPQVEKQTTSSQYFFAVAVCCDQSARLHFSTVVSARLCLNVSVAV